MYPLPAFFSFYTNLKGPAPRPNAMLQQLRADPQPPAKRARHNERQRCVPRPDTRLSPSGLTRPTDGGVPTRRTPPAARRAPEPGRSEAREAPDERLSAVPAPKRLPPPCANPPKHGPARRLTSRASSSAPARGRHPLPAPPSPGPALPPHPPASTRRRPSRAAPLLLGNAALPAAPALPPAPPRSGQRRMTRGR